MGGPPITRFTKSSDSSRKVGRDGCDRATGLVQFIYVSVEAWALNETEIHRIAESSRRNNARSGLTGLLLNHGGKFYGVLEGSGRRVLSRMEIIAADPRHRRLQIVSERPAPERRFENWLFGRLPGGALASDEMLATDIFISEFARRAFR